MPINEPYGGPTTADMSSSDHGAADVDSLMTIGELSRRTGVSVKALRRYEGMGLIYTAGRSASNYRLFDESALCGAP